MVTIDDETIASIKTLNPTRNTPFQAWNTDQIEPPTMLQEIFPSQVQRAINSLDAETNPGLMQFRGEHLQDLIGKKGGIRHGEDFLKAYSKLINLIAKGNVLPMDYHQFLSSCQSVPIPKGQTGIRPIAMPHISRKITEKCLASLYSTKFQNHFRGLQFGVSTPSGSEKMIHEILDQQTAQVENDIIVLDSENAFNNQK